MADELGWQQNSVAASFDNASYATLHGALIAGLPTQLGQRGDKSIYEGPRGRRF